MVLNMNVSGIVATNAYYLEEDGKGYLIDAPDGIGSWIGKLKDEGKRIDAVLLTHGHFDHVMGLVEVKKIFPDASVYLRNEDWQMVKQDNLKFLSFFGIPLSLYHIPEDMEFLDYPYENYSFRFIPTPGHTKGGVSILWKDNGILFSGDTLFQMGEGRSDLGGDRETLMASIRKLSLLPPETIVLPGHGGRTTIGGEARRLGFTQP